MEHNDAYYLLFEHDFGKGPLFKNQVELVYEFVNTPGSAYFLPGSEKATEQYARVINRLKAYLSQLFSEGAKRAITPDFQHSLRTVLEKKHTEQSFDLLKVLNFILSDLREKNPAGKYLPAHSPQPDTALTAFSQSIRDASAVSIFTTGEIALDLNTAAGTISVAEFLIDDFITSFSSNFDLKSYSFNFPLYQTCILFWRGLRKAMAGYLQSNKNFLPPMLSLLEGFYHPREDALAAFRELVTSDEFIETEIVDRLLHTLSLTGILQVYHLPAPVYIASSIAIDPNNPRTRSVYLLWRSPTGEHRPHKLTDDELTNWKLFFWEKLKIDNAGKPIPYGSQLCPTPATGHEQEDSIIPHHNLFWQRRLIPS